ncbi:glycosyltransferase family 2 protein [Aurantibacillus circumpalustris]|uniref:glycosyltransferase family 2 protein n=1 Tax=Aurantibacillus circumpalustris TaxID=3036359 RepID=UPI00295A974C|nr:glycosyltransferase family 2 protein [Aurantibacillus circumpalustris]
MSESNVAVVILNFNGKSFLEKFLPGIIKNSSPHKIVVADNGSTDDSLNYLESHFPQVSIIKNGGNYGYAKGYNLALQKVEADYFVLLNSDVEVTPNWIEPIILLMDVDKQIAACQPKLIDYAKRNLFEYAGASGGFIDKYGYPFCRGRIFNTLEEDNGQHNVAREVFWASGACLFIRADAFRRVGGFDDDYFAHMEEIDLCWRLKNLGYKIYVEPASVIYHIGGGTLNKLSKRKTFLNFRNNLVTYTKNSHSSFLFWRILLRFILDGVAAFKFLFDGQPKHFFAVLKAHGNYYLWLPRTLAKRRLMKRMTGFNYTETEIYQSSIVSEHFLKHKNKFSDLQESFFKTKSISR